MENAALLLTPAAVPDLLLRDGTLGRFRRELMWTIGEKKTHSLFARVGFSFGQSEGNRKESPLAGIDRFGEVARRESHKSATQHVFEFSRSIEAVEHKLFFDDPSGQSQCWLLAGYLTGAVSAQFDHPIYFLETQCVAKGDSCCRFVGQNRDAWNEEAITDLTYYDEDNVALELAQTQEQLQLTRDRYQTLFEQSSLAIFIIDPETGVPLDVNFAAGELSGYTRGQLLHMTLFDLCHQQDHNRLMGDMKALLAGQKIGEREITLVRNDGVVRVIAHSSKILSYGGKRVMQAIMRDVTDLKISAQKEKDLQHQLVRSERLSSIGRLAAGVAHELKNPLGAIRNAIYYIRNALKDTPVLQTDPHLKEIMKLAESEVDASVVIIGELLDFSRVVQLVPRRTLVNDLIEKLPSLYLIPENIEFALDLDLTLPAATVDPDRLTQVFINIVANAVQAMPVGGALKVRTRFVVETGAEGANEELIIITFEDSGCGIEPVHLSKIFEPLFTTKARGTGLGLAISRNIVEKHGGVILVTSRIGKGTSFTIKLPLQPPAEREEKNHEQRTNIAG